MNKRIWKSLSLLTLILLTGCWDRAELPEKGFVMGVALDKADDNKILLTTQLFKPTQGVGAIGARAAETAYVNVSTIDDTVPRAIRDIPINIGRKTQWSHTRLIIIGEELAREREIYDLLEFFFRDHEPRLTVSVVIAEGNADKYLKMKPLIENTMSQQLFQSEKSSAMNSGKSIDSNLLKLGLQMKSELGNAITPYVYLSKDTSSNVTNIAGVALLKAGKLVGVMEPSKVEALQILRNKYNSGMINIPCKKNKQDGGEEAVEIVSIKSKWQPASLQEKPLKVQIKINMEVAVMELTCSKLDTVEEEKKFSKSIEENMKQRIKETTDWLKQNKFDAIGLGNKVYQANPKLWRKWKPTWDNRFAESMFDIEVEAKITNSGTTIGNPIFE